MEQRIKKYKTYIIMAVISLLLGIIIGYTIYFEIENYIRESRPDIFLFERKEKIQWIEN